MSVAGSWGRMPDGPSTTGAAFPGTTLLIAETIAPEAVKVNI